MKENLVLELSYQFALEVVGAARVLREAREYDLASQIWRSGTSIGANAEEAQSAQSRADFKSKMSISAKEARECHYWLRLARDSGALNAETSAHLLDTCDQLRRILTSIVKSSE